MMANRHLFGRQLAPVRDFGKPEPEGLGFFKMCCDSRLADPCFPNAQIPARGKAWSSGLIFQRLPQGLSLISWHGAGANH